MELPTTKEWWIDYRLRLIYSKWPESAMTIEQCVQSRIENKISDYKQKLQHETFGSVYEKVWLWAMNNARV